MWGGYSTPSSSGAHYVFTIVDDHYHATWVYLMRMKFDTYTCLTHFHDQIKNHFQRSILNILTNNGQEFL